MYDMLKDIEYVMGNAPNITDKLRRIDRTRNNHGDSQGTRMRYTTPRGAIMEIPTKQEWRNM